MWKIVGLVRGTSKAKNTPYTVLHCVTDFEEYQLPYADGNKVQEAFIRGYLDVEVGDEVELVYGVGYEGKAIVTGVNVLDRNSN